MNIGIFSGSFNPIHLGHTSLAQYICTHCNLDEVWLMVSPNNPLKDKSALWDENLRLRLARVATRDLPRIIPSDFEFHLPRPSYTVDTLKQLTSAYPCHTFSLIIGSDNLTIFNQWKDYNYILLHYPVIVYPRKGDNIAALKTLYPQITILEHAPEFDVSSTMIRQKLMAGESIDKWVDTEVNNILIKEYLQD